MDKWSCVLVMYRLRVDEVVEFEERKAMLDLVPDREGAFVKIPKISTGADADVKCVDKAL